MSSPATNQRLLTYVDALREGMAQEMRADPRVFVFGLDVDDHSELHIDEIVVGVGEKRRSSHRAGPLGSRVGRRDELRRDLAGRTEGRVIEGCQVLLHGAARSLGITRLLPFRARDRTLLVGISYNQARIDRKPFTTD